MPTLEKASNTIFSAGQKCSWRGPNVPWHGNIPEKLATGYTAATAAVASGARWVGLKETKRPEATHQAKRVNSWFHTFTILTLQFLYAHPICSLFLSKTMCPTTMGVCSHAFLLLCFITSFQILVCAAFLYVRKHNGTAKTYQIKMPLPHQLYGSQNAVGTTSHLILNCYVSFH